MKSLVVFLFAAALSAQAVSTKPGCVNYAKGEKHLPNVPECAQTVKPAFPLICGDGKVCRKDVEPGRCVCLPKSATVVVVKPAPDIPDTTISSYCDAPSHPCAFADAYVTDSTAILSSVVAASFECLTPDDSTLKDCKLKNGHTLTEALQTLYTVFREQQDLYNKERADRDKDRIEYIKFLDSIQRMLKCGLSCTGA
jgi:hypothetical protein